MLLVSVSVKYCYAKGNGKQGLFGLTMANYYIGRQPIFDSKMRLFGYELLFRSGSANKALVIDDDIATSTVLANAFTEIGLDRLVGDKYALINMPYQFLVDHEHIAFPPGKIIFEILEHTKIDDELIDSVAALKQQGYLIALDDFVYSKDWEPLVELADLIKIDITLLSRQKLEEQVKDYKRRGIKILAERIENLQEYESLTSLGFDYFQGYFFAKPKVISGRKIPSNKMQLVQLLAEINSPNSSAEDVANLVSNNLSLSTRTIRYVNSPMSGLSSPISSIKHAVTYLGLGNLRKWLNIMLMSEVNTRSSVILGLGLMRARFCENIAEKARYNEKDTYFLVGLFSVLDSLLEITMDNAVKDLNLAEDVKLALTRNQGDYGRVLQLVKDIETKDANPLAADYPNDWLRDAYIDAIKWADEAQDNLEPA